jgi:hypothetical protein
MRKDVIKTCCAKSAVLYIIDKPVLKIHIELFEKAGFLVPARYAKSGLLYLQRKSFVGTASFGMCKINVRCSGNGCVESIQLFESIISQIEK